MEVSCKELFDLFQIVGGKLSCSYKDQECTYFNPNRTLNSISCKVNEKNIKQMASLFRELKYNYIKKLSNTELDKITFHHDYLSKNSMGITIKLSDDNEGFSPKDHI